MYIEERTVERLVVETTYTLEGVTMDELQTIAYCLDFAGDDIPGLYSRHAQDILSKVREAIRGF
jgi:hypothetical protein